MITKPIEFARIFTELVNNLYKLHSDPSLKIDKNVVSSTVAAVLVATHLPIPSSPLSGITASDYFLQNYQEAVITHLGEINEYCCIPLTLTAKYIRVAWEQRYHSVHTPFSKPAMRAVISTLGGGYGAETSEIPRVVSYVAVDLLNHSGLLDQYYALVNLMEV